MNHKFLFKVKATEACNASVELIAANYIVGASARRSIFRRKKNSFLSTMCAPGIRRPTSRPVNDNPTAQPDRGGRREKPESSRLSSLHLISPRLEVVNKTLTHRVFRFRLSLQLLTNEIDEEVDGETIVNETYAGILWEATCFTTAIKVEASSDRWILRYIHTHHRQRLTLSSCCSLTTTPHRTKLSMIRH